MLKPFVSAREAARVLRIGDRTLRLMIRRGEIKVIRAKEGERGKLYIPCSEILTILGTLDENGETPARAGAGE